MFFWVGAAWSNNDCGSCFTAQSATGCSLKIMVVNGSSQNDEHDLRMLTENYLVHIAGTDKANAALAFESERVQGDGGDGE